MLFFHVTQENGSKSDDMSFGPPRSGPWQAHRCFFDWSLCLEIDGLLGLDNVAFHLPGPSILLQGHL